MYRSDSHVHSEFSGDSKEKLEKIIEKAKELKMDEITITDHLDLDFPMKPNIFTLDLEKYIERLKELRKREKELQIKIGIEIGLQPTLVNRYNSILENKDIDSIRGSSHAISGKDVATKDFFLGKEKNEAHREYFLEVLKNIDLFPEISVYGHLDFINRYGIGVYKDYKDLDYILHQDIIDEILKKLIFKNIGIEVNTSGLRYGLKNFHPHINILKRYKKFGGEIITIGSDSHRSEDIMKDFDIVKKLLKELGFNSYCTFKNKKIEYRDLDI